MIVIKTMTELPEQKDERIKMFIKENFEPVEDKPGYVWLSKRHLQIISIETLSKAIESHLRESEVQDADSD